MGRRWPAQIVAMCNEDTAAWVRDQAVKDEETIAGELRLQVKQNRRLREIAERGGWSVDEVLSHLEKSITAAA